MKIRENAVVLCCLALFNFDFTRKIAKIQNIEKFVKTQWLSVFQQISTSISRVKWTFSCFENPCIVLNVFFFRCPLLWIHCQFCLRCTPLDELCQSLLVAILGRHSKSIQEHGTLGVLFLQISPSRLPIRSSFPWLPRPLWRRVPLDQRETITRMVDGRPALCHSGTHCLLPGTNGHCLLASSSAFGVDFAL